MSGPDARLMARDKFNPRKQADETRREMERIARGFSSIRKTIRRSIRLIEQSRELLKRLPDR